MAYKYTVIIALTIALFGHLAAAGRTLHDQTTITDASDIESRKLLQQYNTGPIYDGSAETITGASDLIAQAVAAGAQPEATAAAASRGAQYQSLTTEDSLAGAPDTGARRLLRGSSVNKVAQSTSEAAPVGAQALVAGAQPDVRSSALKAGADFLKLSTVDDQPLRADPDLVRKRSMLQRVFSADKPDHSRPLLGAAAGDSTAPTSAVAGVQSDVKSSSMKAGADYLKLSTLDPQMMLPKEDIGA